MSKRKALHASDATPEGVVKKARFESVDLVGVGDSGNAGSGRRSARIAGNAARRKGNLQMPCHTLEDSDLDEPVTNKKGKKRRKSSSKKYKNTKVGQLTALLDMPIDIFDEVASHLSTHDLLNMSRASKAFRDLLTSRGSKTAWNAARESMGLPECPGDISEMQYADLLFGKGCYLCDAPRAQSLYFCLRLRLCARCRDVELCSALELRTMLNCNCEFLDLVPSEATHYNFYYLGDVISLWRVYQSIPADSTERAVFVEARQRAVAEIEDNAERVQCWINFQRRVKANEQNEIAMERERRVTERLKLKGYADGDLASTLDSNDLRSRWSKLTRDPKPLTDRIWRNLEPKLDLVISERRAWHFILETIAASRYHSADCFCNECLNYHSANDLSCLCPLCVDTDHFGYVDHVDPDSDGEPWQAASED